MVDGSLVNSFPLKDTNSNQGGYNNVLKFSPNEEFIAFSDRMWTTETIHIGNIKTGTVDTLRLDRERTSSFHFSHDNKLLASTHSNGLVYIWDIKNKKRLHSLQAAKEGYIYSSGFSHDNNLLVTSNTNGETKVWNTQTGALIDSFMVNSSIYRILFSEDDKFITILSTPNSHEIRYTSNSVENYYFVNMITWSLKEKAIVKTIEKEIKYANSLDFSPDGNRLAVNRNLPESRNQLELWDLKESKTHKPTTIIRNTQLAELPQFTFSETDELIFYNDTSVSIWNIKNDLSFKKKHVFNSQILEKSKDSRLYALNSPNGASGLQIFDIDKNEVIATHKQHDAVENDVEFSADNRYIISSDYGENY